MSAAGFRKLTGQLQNVAAKLDQLLEHAAGEHVYFSLHIWPAGQDGADAGGHGSMLYVSNATREDVVRCMRDVIKQWEAGNDGAALPPGLVQ